MLTGEYLTVMRKDRIIAYPNISAYQIKYRVHGGASLTEMKALRGAVEIRIVDVRKAKPGSSV
jgi:hypothetical protein